MILGPAQHAARRHASQIAHFIYYSLSTSHDVTVALEGARKEIVGSRARGSRTELCVCVSGKRFDYNIFLRVILASSIDILWPFAAHKNSFTLSIWWSEALWGEKKNANRGALILCFPPENRWRFEPPEERHTMEKNWFSRPNYPVLRNTSRFRLPSPLTMVHAHRTSARCIFKNNRRKFSVSDLYRSLAAKMTTVQIQRKRKFHSSSRSLTITTSVSVSL